MISEQERLRRYRRDQATRKTRIEELRTANPTQFREYRAHLNAQSREWKLANDYVAPRDPERRKTLQIIWKAKNRERIRVSQRRHYSLKKRENIAFNLRLKFDAARARAKKKGVPFDITPDDIVVPAVCPILGIPLIWKTRTGKGERDHAPSLDRIRPTEGYVKGNIQIISARANRWKSDMTLDDAKQIVAYMELHNIT